MSKTYWMVVLDQENLDITKEQGFGVQGMDVPSRRKATRITPEDRLLYYVRDRRGFAATATVRSEHFEEKTRVWKHHSKEELYPNRVEIAADFVLQPADYIDAREIAPTLEYVKKWPAELWPHAFFGMLHILPQRDFNLIEAEIRKIDEAAQKRATDDPSRVVTAAAKATRRKNKRRTQTSRRRRRAKARTASKGSG